MNYNLLDEQWIPVLYHDGRTGKVGILRALEDAAEIRCITLASPLDLFAVHRFLLTLLCWRADVAGGIEDIRESLLTGQGVPFQVLDAIRKETHCFGLFDDTAPFLQDFSVCTSKERKSVGSLFAECSTGTNIAHFNHGDDENMRLCLPCLALGMLRVVPWSQSGGQGLTPSVYNAPPVTAIAIGSNLASTLGLNLVPMDGKAGKAVWSGYFHPTDPTKPIPYLEALTWNPRRIFVPLAETGDCWYCGHRDVPTVGAIVYMKNEYTKKRPDERLFEWQDPAAFYVHHDLSKKYDKQKNAPYKTVKSSQESLAAKGCDLPDPEKDCLPTIHAQNSDHEGWLLVIPCTNPANNKTFDHRQVELADFSPESIHALLLQDPPSGVQGLNGWELPKGVRRPAGIQLFLGTAAGVLTSVDWATLGAAEFQDMHDSPAAFDVLSGLYWGLRDRKVQGLPTRNVAWLMLKLMAAVPSHARASHASASFNPLHLLPQRQAKELGRASPYPISLPRGSRLEAALRTALDSHMRKRYPEPVDWIGLCCALNQLLD